MLNVLAQIDTTVYDVPVEENTGLLAALGSFMLLFLALAIIGIIGLWKTFEKAGVEGWKAIIPIYNQWILFELAGKPGWWALVSLGGIIPVLGIFASIAAFVLWIIAALELGKAFGQSQAFSIIGLGLFPFVGFLMLGFGNATYTKPAGATTPS